VRQIRSILRTTIRKGHHSILEHASFTFSISHVSRVLTHQLVRHRIASYSQQSQRYVRLDKPSYTTPPSIAIDSEFNRKYKRLMKDAWGLYSHLVEGKVAEEDARFVLPNAASTNIVLTMNARELLHFFELRCCIQAQWEIRKMALTMLARVKVVAPTIFENAGPLCTDCPEGVKSCAMQGRRSPRKKHA
jgi:thymidylate synthase (FAD)